MMLACNWWILQLTVILIGEFIFSEFFIVLWGYEGFIFNFDNSLFHSTIITLCAHDSFVQASAFCHFYYLHFFSSW